MLSSNVARVNKKTVEAAGGKWDESLEKAAAEAGTDPLAKNKMLSTVVQHLDDVTDKDWANIMVIKLTNNDIDF